MLYFHYACEIIGSFVLSFINVEDVMLYHTMYLG